MRTAITDSLIASLRANTDQHVEVWDTRVPGLVLRMRGTNRAVWVVRSRTADGKRTTVKLGEHPALGAGAARRGALIQLALIHQGRDPVAERRAAREARKAAAAAMSVEAAMTEWQKARADAADRAWSPRYVRAVASAVRVHIFPSLGHKPLREIGRDKWTRTIAKVAQDKPGAAAFVYTVVSSFLAYAEVMGWIDHHPLPRRGRNLIVPHVPPRTRVLGDHEWMAVWKAAEREPPKLRAFVRLLLLTATRVSEAADITIAEIISNRNLWIIPAARTKNRCEHMVPLGDLAQRELVLVWPQDAQSDSAWCLLGRSPRSGFSGQGKLLTRLQRALGTGDWTWHDFRRTARTTMTYLDVAEADAEAALNHITRRGGLVGVYDRSGPPSSALTALRTWQGYVADVVEGRRSAGDAERQYRAALPEELRDRPKPRFISRLKAKPGRPRQDRDARPST